MVNKNHPVRATLLTAEVVNKLILVVRGVMATLKKVSLYSVIFSILFILWLLFSLRLSFQNLQTLYYDYATFHNKSDKQKQKQVIRDTSPLIEFIYDNTPSNAKILIVSSFNSIFFNYYLHPRKTIWNNDLSLEEASKFAQRNGIDFIVIYDMNKKPTIRNITK